MTTVVVTDLAHAERCLRWEYDRSDRISAEWGYYPERWHGMIRRYGIVQATKILLEPLWEPQEGYWRLPWELTVESIVLLPWCRALFTDDELDEARKRLGRRVSPARLRSWESRTDGPPCP